MRRDAGRRRSCSISPNGGGPRSALQPAHTELAHITCVTGPRGAGVDRARGQPAGGPPSCAAGGRRPQLAGASRIGRPNSLARTPGRRERATATGRSDSSSMVEPTREIDCRSAGGADRAGSPGRAGARRAATRASGSLRIRGSDCSRPSTKTSGRPGLRRHVDANAALAAAASSLTGSDRLHIENASVTVGLPVSCPRSDAAARRRSGRAAGASARDGLGCPPSRRMNCPPAIDAANVWLPRRVQVSEPLRRSTATATRLCPELG